MAPSLVQVAAQPTVPTNVFDQLQSKDAELRTTVAQFRVACAELAAKNGTGSLVRRSIRQAILQTRGTSRGPSR